MVQLDDEVPFEPTGRGVFAEQTFEAPNVQSADVRSTVEHQFMLMEQAHDRIRAEELAARLRKRLAS